MRPTAARHAAPARWRAWIIYASVVGLVLVLAKAVNRVDGISVLRLNPGIDGTLRFDYEHEFIRRGLLGETLTLVRYPSGGFAMFLFSVAAYCVLSALVVIVVDSALPPVPAVTRQVTTVVLLLLPFSMPYFASQLGRVDTVLYVLAITLIVWRRAPWAAFLLCGIAGVLIHENFVVVELPLIVACVASGRPIKALPRDARIALCVAGGAAAFLLVMVAGSLTSMSESAFVAELDREVPGYSAYVADSSFSSTRALEGRGGFSFDETLGRYDLWLVADVVIATIPAVALVFFFARLRGGTDWIPLAALAVAPVGLLFFLGIDLGRWVALASFNLLVVLLIELRDRPVPASDMVLEPAAGDRNPLAVLVPRLRVPAVLVTASVALGPLGVNTAYPVWVEIVGHARALG
jgi:hypothetical protein